MRQATCTLVKNAVVAAVLGLAALATWAVTDSPAPGVEVTAVATHQG